MNLAIKIRKPWNTSNHYKQPGASDDAGQKHTRDKHLHPLLTLNRNIKPGNNKEENCKDPRGRTSASQLQLQNHTTSKARPPSTAQLLWIAHSSPWPMITSLWDLTSLSASLPTPMAWQGTRVRSNTEELQGTMLGHWQSRYRTEPQPRPSPETTMTTSKTSFVHRTPSPCKHNHRAWTLLERRDRQ